MTVHTPIKPSSDPVQPSRSATPVGTVLFAGGGTGGHLFPALAVAERLVVSSRALGGVRCRFLCSTRAIDAEILGAETLVGGDVGGGEGHVGTKSPVDFIAIPAYPPALRPRAFVRFISNWSLSVRAARAQIRASRAQGPVVVVAMGGFVAAPCVQAARVEKCPIIMVNLDATPGRANRWIARHADQILNAAPGSADLAPTPKRTPWQPITPIVRQAALAPGDRAECRRQFGLDPDRLTLFVTGASLGAASVNGFLAEFVRAHRDAMRGWQVIHQTGKGDIEPTRQAYAEVGIPAVVMPFLRTIGQAWGAADAAVGRAGAGSVAEAWANRVPTLFLPYPYHADQHQKRNAEPLVRAGAALLAEDRIQPQATLQSAGPSLLELIQDGGTRDRLSRGLKNMPKVDGAERVAREVLATLVGVLGGHAG